jgi:hypothetical protein
MLHDFNNIETTLIVKHKEIKNILSTLDSGNIIVSEHFEKSLLKSNEQLRNDIRDVNQNLINIKILLDSLPSNQNQQVVNNVVRNTDSFLASMERIVMFIEIQSTNIENELVKWPLISLGILLLLILYFICIFSVFLKHKMTLRKNNLDELEKSKLYVPNKIDLI